MLQFSIIKENIEEGDPCGLQAMKKLNTEFSSFLQSADVCSNMELEKVAELYETMRKEAQLKSFCDY